MVEVFLWCCNGGLGEMATEWTDGLNVELWLLSDSAPTLEQRLKLTTGVLGGCVICKKNGLILDMILGQVALLSETHEQLITRFKLQIK